MEKNKKPKKGLIIGIVVAIILIAAIGSGGSNEDKAKNTESQTIVAKSTQKEPEKKETEVKETEKKETEVKEPETEKKPEKKETEAKEHETEKEPEMTMGQKNAIAKAEQYLDYSAFSKKGLIEQLKFEGFDQKDAEFAVKNCGADWNEQAAKKAQQYLDYSSFSKKSLIEQLVFEGFTQKQAEYGAKAVGY